VFDYGFLETKFLFHCVPKQTEFGNESKGIMDMKKAIVTGATSGIGKEVAKILTRNNQASNP